MKSNQTNYLYVTASQVDAAPFIKDARPRRNTYQVMMVMTCLFVVKKLFRM